MVKATVVVVVTVALLRYFETAVVSSNGFELEFRPPRLDESPCWVTFDEKKARKNSNPRSKERVMVPLLYLTYESSFAVMWMNVSSSPHFLLPKRLGSA